MKKKIDFILFNGALGLDVTGPLEVFNTCSVLFERNGKPGAGYAPRFFCNARSMVRLSSGLEINALPMESAPSSCDMLMVPGGPGVKAALNDNQLIRFIKAKAAVSGRMVSVCNGAFLLAKAGLLDNRKATTHWLVTEELKTGFPKVNVLSDAIYTCDGPVYTSAGVTAGIDLALAIVEEDFGISQAVEISRHLLIYFRRPGSQSQFSTPLKTLAAAGDRFAELHDWLLTHLTDPISVEDMADQSAMSPRNFSRIFKKTTGLTPAKYLEALRLDRAREILTSGGDSIENIAASCGFGREDRLRRAFFRRFKLTPTQYQFHFSQAS